MAHASCLRVARLIPVLMPGANYPLTIRLLEQGISSGKWQCFNCDGWRQPTPDLSTFLSLRWVTTGQFGRGDCLGVANLPVSGQDVPTCLFWPDFHLGSGAYQRLGIAGPTGPGSRPAKRGKRGDKKDGPGRERPNRSHLDPADIT